jgi:hypothetical protein
MTPLGSAMGLKFHLTRQLNGWFYSDRGVLSGIYLSQISAHDFGCYRHSAVPG